MQNFHFKLNNSDEGKLLARNIRKHCYREGISMHRFWLLGMAAYLEMTGKSPELIEQIADYVLRKERKLK